MFVVDVLCRQVEASVGLITRPEESYRQHVCVCVCVRPMDCDLETSVVATYI